MIRYEHGEPDFSICQLKVNAAGSWANVLNVTSQDYDRVKTACLMLAECALGRLKFKLLDADGGILEMLDVGSGGVDGYDLAWREPRRRSGG